MNAAKIEIPPVDERIVERLWRRACDVPHEVSEARFEGMMTQAMNAAKARSPRLLLALERCAEVIDRQADRQSGRTRRTAETAPLRLPPTEVAFFREAYTTASAGSPEPALVRFYIAVGEYVGVVA